MANSEWSTSNPSGGKYQVFLSFRGADTRHTFTSSLYRALHDAGICAFFDDEEIRPGNIISDDLVQGINDSMFYIPIFSKKYATSHWCLRELAMMVKCDSKSKEEGKEKVILPIFYDVELDDVKLKTPLYNEAILNLVEKDQKKFDSEVVGTWRRALQEVCCHKGLKREKSDDGDLIKLVVHEVLVKLKIRQRPVTKSLVGMEDRIEAINNLLDEDSSNAQVIVIYGMGGIGKTTLAKLIFNQLCPRFGNSCSFLEDVRETVQTEDGLVKLQKRLLSDIFGSEEAGKIADKDQGINRIGETICNKEVLIVLDDVGSRTDIHYLIRVNSLCAGTIIIVTSRDKSVLNESEFKDILKDYEMTPLSEEDAFKLFCKHAFGDNSRPDNDDALSKEIASTVKGLPLALEVIGSSLFGRKEKEIWEERLESLKKTPHDDVLGILKISYDALEENQQSIFLDVACFFVGEDKTNPTYMWSDFGFFPDKAIEVLTRRCMMKVVDDDKFGMHDQLRDLGRKIARDKGTRLWDGDDIIPALRRTKADERVEALRLGVPRARLPISSEQIKRFPNMRFLWLYDVNCQGDFTGCLPNLRWIELRYFHISPDQYGRNQHLEATNLLRLENAVVVLSSGLQFTDDAFESLIQGARKLKVLNITRNNSIHRTPTFPADSELEKLTIFDNFHFSEIDCSIGRLQHLTELSFESCYGLQKLPEQIGELRNLQHLSLKSCHHLIELPESISKLESLTTLDVYGTKIRNLPHSIGGLPRLSFLDLSHLPIAEMPRTMSQFCQLRTLKMFRCNEIQELPELPGSLTNLELTSKSLRTIPNLSCLNKLVELALSDGNDVEGRSGLIQDCELPWMGRSSELRKLSFRFPSVRAPTTQLSSLYLLKELTLEGVDLPTFEQIPSGLTVLELYDARGKQGHLDGPSQSEKEIDSRGKRARTDGLSQSEKETDTRGKRARTDGLLECKELQALELTDQQRVVFSFPSSQKELQKFRLSGFPEVQHIQFVSTFQSLEEFSVAECSSLKKLGDLSNLKNMKRLDILSCENLQSIKGIDELMFLRWLKIEKCRSLEMIFEASSSKIPNSCSIYIRRSGELPDCGRTFYTWETYRAKILNGRKQVSDTEADFDTDAELDFDPNAEVDTDSEMDFLDPDAVGDTDSMMESTDSENETGD